MNGWRRSARDWGSQGTARKARRRGRLEGKGLTPSAVRAGFRHLIETAPDMEVVEEAVSGEEACHRAPSVRPDVVVLDLSMPGIGGLEAISRLARVAPEELLTAVREVARGRR